MLAGLEQPVAQIGFRERTQHHGGAARPHEPPLARRGVGRVDEPPAGPEFDELRQPRDRRTAEPVAALRHLRLLFGDVDVKRRFPSEQGIHALDQIHEFRTGHGAERMRGHARHRLQARDRFEKTVHRVVNESPLLRSRRGSIEAAGPVVHGKERHGQPRVRCRPPDRLRRLGPPPAVAPVMEMVELDDPGESGHQHLAVRLSRHGIQLFGLDPGGETVHLLAPRPERILAPRGLSEADEGTLEGVRVGVHHAGEGQEAVVRRAARTHRHDGPVLVDVETTIAFHSRRSEYRFERQRPTHESPPAAVIPARPCLHDSDRVVHRPRRGKVPAGRGPREVVRATPVLHIGTGCAGPAMRVGEARVFRRVDVPLALCVSRWPT